MKSNELGNGSSKVDELTIVREVCLHPFSTVEKIGEELNINPTTVCKIVFRLQHDHLVSVCWVNNDVKVCLTGLGVQLLNSHSQDNQHCGETGSQ